MTFLFTPRNVYSLLYNTKHKEFEFREWRIKKQETFLRVKKNVASQSTSDASAGISTFFRNSLPKTSRNPGIGRNSCRTSGGMFCRFRLSNVPLQFASHFVRENLRSEARSKTNYKIFWVQKIKWYSSEVEIEFWLNDFNTPDMYFTKNADGLKCRRKKFNIEVNFDVFSALKIKI